MLVFLVSITVFCEVQTTKHCNAQKIPKFPNLKLTKHCNAQKIQKILASMARPGADSLRFWNFLSITVFHEFQGLEKLIF